MPKKFNLNIYALLVFIISFSCSFAFSKHVTYSFNSITEKVPVISLAIKILLHNYSLFLADLLSFIFGRWVILVSLAINMIQLGIVIGTASNMLETILMLLPHGIIEITAILLMANLCWKGIEWALSNKKKFLQSFLLANLTLTIAAAVEAIYLYLIN